MNQQFVSLAGEVVGPGVLQQIPPPPSGEPEELCINATGVTKVDSYAAVAIQAAFQQHVAANPESTACLWAPADPECQRRLYSLLGNLPERCTLPDDFETPKRDPRSIIPAMAISNLEEAELIGRTIRVAGSTSRLGNLRLSAGQAQVLAIGAVALLDNALKHPTENPCSPLISCSIEAKSRNVQVVVHDLGKGVANKKAPLSLLRQGLEQSKGQLGGISSTTELLQRRGDDAVLVIRAGTAQARWSGSWETRDGGYSPGWGIGLTIERDQAHKAK